MEEAGEPVVAIAGDCAIDRDPRAHGETTFGQRSESRKEKGQRGDRVRRDAGEGAALADRLAGPNQIDGLQVAQAAVQGPQMVERRSAAEVGALDQRHRQAPLRRVAGDRQPVDAAADDEQIKWAADEPRRVTGGHGRSAVDDPGSVGAIAGDATGARSPYRHLT
jgi:hypothetical protein